MCLKRNIYGVSDPFLATTTRSVRFRFVARNMAVATCFGHAKQTNKSKYHTAGIIDRKYIVAADRSFLTTVVSTLDT
jgi:hypothetical protein